MGSDEELLGRWREGDREAGNLLVRRYFAPIARYLQNKVCNPEDATDLVGQTFLACTTAKDGFRGETSFRRYLYSIADNVLREYIRAKSRQKLERIDFAEVCVGQLPAATPSSLIMDGRRAQVFVDALRRVSLSDQIVLEHRYFENRNAAAIAECMGIPAATVRGRLMRARNRLRTEVERLLAVPGTGPDTPVPSYDELDAWAGEVRQSLDWDGPGDAEADLPDHGS